MKTTQFCLIGALALGSVWLAGCSTPDVRIRDNPAAFAQLPPEQQQLVRGGRVGIGLSMEAVKLALGNPDGVTVRTNLNGEVQIWHYVQYDYYDAGFLYPGAGWGMGYGGGYGRRWGRGGWGGGWGGWGGGGWGGWGGGWGMMDDYAVPYDHFRIEFKDGKVSSINEERPD